MRENHSTLTSITALRRPSLVVLLGMLLALTAVEVSLRVWLIAKSDIIAQDGTYFLRMARELRVDPTKAMREFVVHPGYPAAVVTVHHFLAGEDGSDDPRLWERAGKYVALVGSILAIWAVWAFGAMIFRNVWIGYFGALLFGLGRKFATTGADVLSDSAMLCFAMWGLVLALQATEALRARRKTVLLWSAGTGLFAAAAYWVRPEGAVVLCIAVTTWLAVQIRRRLSWRLTIGAVLLAVVAAALAAAPYGFTNKWRIENFALPASAVSHSLTAWLGVNELAPTPALLRFIGRFFEAQQPILASLTCLYFVLLCTARTRYGAKLREAPPAITRTGGMMILLSFVWIVPPIVLRYWSTGALSHRYLFLSAAMLAGAPVAAVVGLARLVAARASSQPAARRIRWGVLTVTILGLAVGLSMHALRPLHAGHIFAKNAGVWLAERIGPGDGLLTDHFFVRYYSQADRFCVIEDSSLNYYLMKRRPDMTPQEYVHERLDAPEGFRYVALIEQNGPTLLKDVAGLLEKRGYRKIKEFPYIKDGKSRPEKRSILVFERFGVTTTPATPNE